MKIGRANVLSAVALAVGLVLIGAGPTGKALAGDAPAAVAPQDAGRAARWKAIAGQIFGDRRIEPTETLIKLDAPARAEDAALVPMTLTMPEKNQIKSVYLIVDDNPSPLAAHVTFGPAADRGRLQLRVRVDSYTNVHAVAETTDGRLVEAVAFVKASGGCSAPAAASDEEAMAGMGEMRMKFSGSAAPGKPAQATLMIRHPNFNGMQMNQLTRNYTPARYIDKISVLSGEHKVFDLTADISLATNPVIGFAFIPDGKASDKDRLKVLASDTGNGSWEHSFDLPAATN